MPGSTSIRSWYLRGMRPGALVFVLSSLFVLAPRMAFAQTPAQSARSAQPQTNLATSEQTWSEVQQQAAEAETAQDCAIACRAHESLARATQHLCDIGPEHCEEARAKLRTATERVRAACPECAAGHAAGVRPEEAGSQPRVATAPPPENGTRTAGSGGGAPDQVNAEAAPQRGGGCAGCTAASARTGGLGFGAGVAILALALVLARVRRRPRRRRRRYSGSTTTRKK